MPGEGPRATHLRILVERGTTTILDLEIPVDSERIAGAVRRIEQTADREASGFSTDPYDHREGRVVGDLFGVDGASIRFEVWNAGPPDGIGARLRRLVGRSRW